MGGTCVIIPLATMKLPDQINVAKMAINTPLTMWLLLLNGYANQVDRSYCIEFSLMLMSKVFFKIPFYPFNGRIKIAEFYLRKFFMDQIHHLFDP